MPASDSNDSTPSRDVLRLGLPKGRMEHGVVELLAAAGIRVAPSARDYRPVVSLEAVETKLLKPQNLLEMLAVGSRDLGFGGADWVAELGLEVVELLDTGLDPVQVVAAAPVAGIEALRGRPVVVASEYVRLAGDWIARRGLDAELLRSYGATEVFPPEDADAIVDNAASGSTLRANGLTVIDTLMRSSTRLYAAPRAMESPAKRARIEDLTLLLRSVLEARARVLVELNAPPDRLEALVALLPCMREVTVSPLYGEGGFALKAAVPREELPTLIPRIREAGGADIVVTRPSQIVP